MREMRLTITTAALLMFCTAGEGTAWAGRIVWFLEPHNGLIFRVNPETGAVRGVFAPPLVPVAGDTRAGLSIADNGRTLLYQLGRNGSDDTERDTLFRLHPLFGFVKSTELGLATAFGPDGLSWQSRGGDTFTFFSHANPIPDIHRIQNLGQPGEEEIFLYGPSSDLSVHPVGGLGGDGYGREFGAFRIDDGPLFIGEYDPFDDASGFLNTFAAPAQDVEGLAFDGRFLYASSASGLLFTLNPDTGRVVHSLSLPDTIPGIANPGEFVFDIAAVPEPSILALFVLSGVAVARRRSIGRRRATKT